MCYFLQVDKPWHLQSSEGNVHFFKMVIESCMGAAAVYVLAGCWDVGQLYCYILCALCLTAKPFTMSAS